MSVLDELSDLRQRAVARLKELEPLVAEYEQLQAVLARLGTEGLGDGTPAAKPARGSRSAAAPRPARKAASRRSGSRRRDAASPGSREADVVRLVGERPGISVPEIAREL